jgi:sulfoquinovose isomerase
MSPAGWAGAAQETARLAAFARGSRHRDGFGTLDEDGAIDPAAPVEAYITGRMTYVFALGVLLGEQADAELADHGIAALSAGPLRDGEYGGWFHSTAREDRKEAYDHAFVVLAAATAACAGRPGARALLDDALRCVKDRFWEAAEGLSRDAWDRRWSVAEDYRGANANMHLVEAFLAAAEATGDGRWRQLALGAASRLIDGFAREHGWRVPEHYDAGWRVRPAYNDGDRAHRFRPYGATIGHWFEWSRLLVHLHAGLDEPPGWLLEDARALFAAGVEQGWHADGADGLVYTVDWSGRPVVRARMHWVVTEAIGAAAVLDRVTGDPGYGEWERRWWDYAQRYLIDRERGGWHQELDVTNRPSATVWSGKPDVYHAYQATILTRAPLASSAGAAAAALGHR